MSFAIFFCFFFFQAEDGIRDDLVTGVQTCALPICAPRPPEQIRCSINAAQQAKYAAIQSENELAKTRADAAKKIAEADGLAKANQVLASSITDKLLEKQRLDIQDRWIARWDGHRAQQEINTGNGMGMILQQGSKQ